MQRFHLVRDYQVVLELNLSAICFSMSLLGVEKETIELFIPMLLNR